VRRGITNVTERVQTYIHVKLNNNDTQKKTSVTTYRKRKRAKDRKYDKDYIYKTHIHTHSGFIS